MTLAFVAASYALAFLQSPGRATSDTKIDLHVEPVRLLSDVASVWTPTGDLGEVHSSQYSGYLFPMGPFFALLHEVGLPPWVVHRLWLGTLLALAAWGTLRLLDALVGRPRGIVHAVAAAFFVVNPYVTVFTGRTSITLLGYAALPWLLLCVHRGLEASVAGQSRAGPGGHARGWLRTWWWPAAFALIFASTGGGVNAAVVAWMCVGPAVLLLYAPAVGVARARDSLLFLGKAGGLAILASLWWIVPLLVHVRFGSDFLQFTEQPRTIWDTNSITESLRLMGYWPSYIGVGFYGDERPFYADGETLLFSVPVLLAGLLVPALALAGYAWTRHGRYASFFLFMTLAGAVIMAAGFPDGTPLRRTMETIYENVFVLRPLRTVNKAAPLVALGVAGLLGLAAHVAWARVRALPDGAGRRVARVALPAALVALLAAASWPLVRGEALDEQLTWDGIPPAWQQAGDDLDRELPENTRGLILPGQVFAFYEWGGTIDAILPVLTERPVAVRYETPYADQHAADLTLTTDGLVQQDRLVPGQLRPLLDLMGVGAVIQGTDDDIERSGAVAPGAAARALAGQGLGEPDASYGPRRPRAQEEGDLAPPARLPQVRRWDVPGGRGLVRVEPTAPATILDGSADGIAALAAFGSLPAELPLLYAADVSPEAVRRAARTGARVVVTDSNRRRPFLPQHSQQNLGATVGAGDLLAYNTPVLNPFPTRGADAQTVSVLRGAAAIRGAQDAARNLFPEHRAFAAFDGRLDTFWVADRTAGPADRWIEIDFLRPTDVPYVDLAPASGAHGVVTEVEILGRRTPVRSGWNRIPVGARDVRTLRVRLSKVRQPDRENGSNAGLREVRVPGVRVQELLRPPVLAARSLAGLPLARVELTYLLSRTTGDQPFRRDPVVGDPSLGNLRNRADAEPLLRRVLFTPAPRAYTPRAWVNAAAAAPDPAFDRLAGVRGDAVFTSSGRFQGQPRHRASSAFDGDVRTAWLGITIPGESAAPWIAWQTPAARTVERLRLVAPRVFVRRPTRVQVSWPGGRTPPLPVAADGGVTLPRPARARRFRLTVLASAFPPGTPDAARARRAVGLASLEVPGLAPVRVPRSGPLRAPCGSVRFTVAPAPAGGGAGSGGQARTIALRPVGTLAALDAGAPLRARACSGPVRLARGAQDVVERPGDFSLHHLELRSPAPAGLPAPRGGGRVTDPGEMGRAGWKDVRVDLRGPSWVVLGQSYNKAWRATCDGRGLGAPQAIDAYANGWLAPADCRRVSFRFEPQDRVETSYVASALVCALLVLLLVAGALLRRRERRAAARDASPARPAPFAPPAPLPDAPVRRWPLWRAALAGVLVSLPLAYVFAARTAPLIALGVAVVLWRGIGPRALALTAGALLGVAVPVLYLAIAPRNENGFNFGYAVELIDAHWVGVAAVLLLALAGWQTVASARRGASGLPPLDGPDEDPPRRVEQEVVGSVPDVAR